MIGNLILRISRSASTYEQYTMHVHAHMHSGTSDKGPSEKGTTSYKGHSIPIGLIHLNLREEDNLPRKDNMAWPQGVLYLEAPLCMHLYPHCLHEVYHHPVYHTGMCTLTIPPRQCSRPVPSRRAPLSWWCASLLPN